MPELPEVLANKHFLRGKVLGHEIVSIEIATSCRYAKNPTKMSGFELFDIALNFKDYPKITNVDNKGKFTYWTLLAKGTIQPYWMHCSYGMSGSWVEPREAKNPVITFSLSNGEKITFDDQRHYGTINFVYSSVLHEKKLESIGPSITDLYSKVGGSCEFVNRIRKYSKKTIAEVLMKQNVVSGVGNYIKAEALYAAKISPWRTIETLSDEQMNELFFCIVTIVQDSYNAQIKKNNKNYSDKSSYEHKVYCKTSDPYGNLIIREQTQDRRMTHWCPAVQK